MTEQVKVVGILVSLQAVCQYVNFINDIFLWTVTLSIQMKQKGYNIVAAGK